MKTLKQIKLEVVSNIVRSLCFKGTKMRFPYYTTKGNLRYADVTLLIKWNQK